jgi:diguanylate cyclase (GGDEF)-like protein
MRYDLAGKVVLVTGAARGIGAHTAREAARAGVLTGLPNRRYLLDYLGAALIRGAHRTEPLAVLFLDLDGFKQVNDTLGHDAGDEVLCVTAQRLIGALRRHDVVARLGGDEFVVVAEEVGDRDKAEDVARRLIESAGQPIDVGDGRTATVVPSIGVTLVSPDRAGSLSRDDLIREADAGDVRRQAGAIGHGIRRGVAAPT